MTPAICQVELQNKAQQQDPPKQFTFDSVYNDDSITETIYADVIFPLVESVLEGYNGTVFAYGQTGCGKSFTMQGDTDRNSPQRGVIPRSFEHIFEAITVASSTKYLIRASYLEIYNESIRDMLGKDITKALELKEHPDRSVQVASLSWHQCTNVTDCEKLMNKGNKNRATGATSMNEHSSRSHSIFTVMVEKCTKSEVDGKEHIRAGKLNLVDLAGSERQTKTHAEGARLREATRINLSLSALGNVISALVDGRSKHIPYRDSKLTRLLQDSLGGNTKTLMIAAISPADDNYEETLSTLRYANRAKNIKNKPKINEDPRDAQMKLLQEEINRLKAELASQSSGGHVLPSFNNGEVDLSVVIDRDEIEREKERLRTEFERQASELRRQCEDERTNYQTELEKLKAEYNEKIDSLANGNGVEPLPNVRRGKKKGARQQQQQTVTSDGDHNDNGAPKDQQEVKKRLQELEEKIVGGEEANNEERKKKRKKKLKDMEEKQRKRYTEVINADDDDVMFRVFDNVQEELHYKNKQLEQERLAKKRLEADNDDLQHEFERDRENYLETIRDFERQMKLFKAINEKISRFVPRSCNYFNLDNIKSQAKYDDEKSDYILPPVITEELQLPPMPVSNQTKNELIVNNQQRVQTRSAGYTNGYVATNGNTRNGYGMYYQNDADYDQDRYGENDNYGSNSQLELEKHYTTQYEPIQPPLDIMRLKRQEQLLSEGQRLRQIQSKPMNEDYMSRRLNPFDPPAHLKKKYG
ncbi:unnamed protein product [Didymodactylos carnosus]|uniref:Kinesin-like protein n=1 Tax=Didymodactylos carnosus TaxID=1234261 RepID=A0A814CWQ9_9BILA|nr:unnamed protein product [Didymodactylos carnosus]CAF1103002.1 unnamed protein product [Didymodactylos carnosus]CAF3722521.1 unnamed protein product [Didymodactylos carnosus]CAF3864264.1 unnamed protein product [Didymodactylos carnosus]